MDISDMDSHLIEQLKRGSRKGINNFVDAYGKFIYNVCYQVLQRNTEAEEATQDSLLKIIGNISGFDGKSSLKAWCYTLAYRTAIDHLRRRKVYTPLEQMQEQTAFQKSDMGVEMMEQKRKVDYLLSTLDTETALIVTLFYLEEKNIKEVAEITGMTESNIKIKLFRARKQMAEKNHIFEFEK